MRQPTLLLVHGWGLGAGVWRPVVQQLGNPPHISLDFGFYGRKQLEIPDDRPLIAVGHSLGFLWLLQYLATASWGGRVEGLVSINGFARFSKADDFPQGVDHCLLRGMKNGLQRDPVKVLNDFRVLGGGPGGDFIGEDAKLRVDAMALAYGLGWLLEWDGRGGLAQWQKPFLAIANSDDNIVTPAISRASFTTLLDGEGSIKWLDQGGHLGLLSRPRAYGELLDRFYRSFL
ncbi:MAG: alpha/beta hydrolase [Magnetococcales bacterium]|nr:alpha/beta hydrolase [Magnetococcales bacterium]